MVDAYGSESWPEALAFLMQEQVQPRCLQVVFSPHLPQQWCYYTFSQQGIQGVAQEPDLQPQLQGMVQRPAQQTAAPGQLQQGVCSRTDERHVHAAQGQQHGTGEPPNKMQRKR